MIAIIPANIGAPKLVPPATVRFVLFVSRKPLAQLPVILVEESLEQYRYPALFGDVLSEMSGTSRKVPLGMPVTPACHVARGVRVLMPPPPAEMLPVELSFQTCSGM